MPPDLRMSRQRSKRIKRKQCTKKYKRSEKRIETVNFRLYFQVIIRQNGGISNCIIECSIYFTFILRLFCLKILFQQVRIIRNRLFAMLTIFMLLLFTTNSFEQFVSNECSTSYPGSYDLRPRCSPASGSGDHKTLGTRLMNASTSSR